MEWRGQITEQVRTHERRFADHNGDLRDLRSEVQSLRDDVIGLKGQVSEARSDIGDAVAAISTARQRDSAERDVELQTLHSAVKEAKITPKDIWLRIVIPLAILVVGGLILFALTGGSPASH